MIKQLLLYTEDNSFAEEISSEIEVIGSYALSIVTSILELEKLLQTNQKFHLKILDFSYIERDDSFDTRVLFQEKQPTIIIKKRNFFELDTNKKILCLNPLIKDTPKQLLKKIEEITKYRDKRVLIVGDDIEEKERTQKALQEKDFFVETSTSLGNHNNELNFDLLLLFGNANELIKDIRKTSSKGSLGIISVLEDNNFKILSNYLANEINEVLLKGFSKEELLFRVNLVMEFLSLNRANRSIQRELNNYKKIVDENVIISKTDVNGFITYVSSAFCQISEYQESELLGKPHNIVRHDDMKSTSFEDLWKTVKSGRVWQGEVKNRKKYGGYYWVEATVRPEFNDDNEIIGFISVRQDITTAKQLEEIYVHQVAEQNQARSKQINSIVNEFEESDYFESKILYHASDILSGDIYSLRTLQDGSALIYILDAMGHGLLPSFTTFAATSIIKRFLDSSDNLQDLMDHFSSSLRTILDDEEQISYSFVHISPDLKTIEYASGGMYPAVLSTSNGVRRLKANNAPFMPFMPDIKVHTINDGEFDKVLIYSDGLVEDEGSGVTSENIEDALDEETLNSVMLFLEINDLEDDTTIIYFKKKV